MPLLPSFSRRLAFLSLACLALTAPAAAQDTHPPEGQLTTPYRLEVVAENLRVPWSVGFLPDGRIVFTERLGRVRIIDKNGALLPDPALTVDVALGNKMGLLGLAVDPHFADNHFLYVAHDYRLEPFDPQHAQYRLRVVRYREENNRLTDAHILIEDVPAWTNHTGCRLRFGSEDGKLYFTTGDANDPPMAQRLDRLNGKILRLNPDGSIPEDNPYVHQSGARPEIWSYGHRNPQGLDFQPGTNKLLETEHGPNGGDEINWITATHNYGWPVIDHRRTQEGMEAPFLEFSPAVAPGSASFYRGDAFPELKGNFLIACLRGESVLRVELDGTRSRGFSFLFHHLIGRVRECAESPEGYLYLSSSQYDPDEGKPRPDDHDDLLLRLVPASTPPSRYREFKPTVADLAAMASPAAPALTGVAAVIVQNCAACHGQNLAGGMQKSLVSGEWKYAHTDDDLRRVIKNGLPEMGMPPAPTTLTSADIESLVTYIRTHEKKNG